MAKRQKIIRCVCENGRPPDRARNQRPLERQIKTSNFLKNETKFKKQYYVRSERKTCLKIMSCCTLISNKFEHTATDLEQVTTAAANLVRRALYKYLSKRKL